MSGDLQQARDLYAAGDDRKALGVLWNAHDAAWDSKEDMRAVLELARTIRARSKRRLKTDADRLVRSATSRLVRLERRAEDEVVIKLMSCRVTESGGWEPPFTGTWELIFTGSALHMRGDRMVTLEYPSIRTLELEQVPPTASQKAQRVAGKAGVILAVGTFLGGDAGRAAARQAFPDQHNIRITLTTALGCAVLVHTCSTAATDLKERISAARAMGLSYGQ